MVTFPMLVVILAIYSASYYAALVHGQPRISLALAAVAFVVAYLGSTL